MQPKNSTASDSVQTLAMAKKTTTKKPAAPKKPAAGAKPSAKKTAKKPAKKTATKSKNAKKGIVKTASLGRPTITAEEKLFMLFHDDYHARQVFEFLRAESVG